MTQGEQAARPSIFLATPAFGGMAGIQFVQSLLALQTACAARGVGLQIELTGGDALITRARSSFATRFLEDTTHTHLMFVDADIAFDPAGLFRLIESGHDVVGGVYPLKRLYWDKLIDAVRSGAKDIEAASLGYVVTFAPDASGQVQVDDDGFGAVAAIGTGFMLISRRALERLREAHPELRCRQADTTGPAREVTLFFDTMIDPDTREHLSEDYAFCRRWRAIGGQVYADFRTRLTHFGPAAYTGSLVDAVAK